MRKIVASLVLAATAAATLTAAAAAQPQVQAFAGGAPTDRLILLCTGTDTIQITTNRVATGYGAATGYARIPAQLGVMLEKGVVRVRPPATSTYMVGRADPDGWYELDRPEVSEFLIRGRSAITGLLSSKLDVDRRTGAAVFGDFVGVCRSVTTNTGGTVF